MNNAVHGETTKNLRNKIDVRLVSNKKKTFKMDNSSRHIQANKNKKSI